MATRTHGRIILPKNPGEMMDLAQKIYDKHLADGTASPLNAQKDFSWAVEGPKIEVCQMNNTKADEATKLAEKHFKQRDVDFPSIRSIVQNSAQLLKNVYAKNPKTLGDYGFVVDDTKKTTEKKPKADQTPKTDK